MVVLLRLMSYDSVEKKDKELGKIDIVIGRLGELRIIDKKTGIVLTTHTLPYGSRLYVAAGQEVEKGKTNLRMGSF